MRSSWIEKNGSRNIIDWERTKNDVRSTISLFSWDLVHTSKICGSGRLGGGNLQGWLGTNFGVPFGMGWSILTYGEITGIMTWLATFEACSIDRAGNWVAWWSWVGNGAGGRGDTKDGLGGLFWRSKLLGI